MKPKKNICLFFFTCLKGKSVKKIKRFMVKQKTTRNPDEDTGVRLIMTPFEG